MKNPDLFLDECLGDRSGSRWETMLYFHAVVKHFLMVCVYKAYGILLVAQDLSMIHPFFTILYLATSFQTPSPSQMYYMSYLYRYLYRILRTELACRMSHKLIRIGVSRNA